MFVLVKSSNGYITTTACSSEYSEVMEKLKEEFSLGIEECGFGIREITDIRVFNNLNIQLSEGCNVREAVKELIEIAESSNEDIEANGMEEDTMEFSFSTGTAHIWTMDSRIDWKILNTVDLPYSGSNEFKFLFDFIEESESLDNEVTQNQLKSLWTAFCIKQNLDVDTEVYDNLVRQMWVEYQKNQSTPYKDNEFERFDTFMCEWLA